MFSDSKERLWLGTDGAGVTIYENKRFRNLMHDQQLNAAVVYSISEDPEGNIWFNTLNEGVFKFDGKRYVKLSVQQRLTNTSITAIMPTAYKELLLVNKNGVDVYHMVSNAVSHFGRERGTEPQQLELNAICRDKEANT